MNDSLNFHNAKKKLEQELKDGKFDKYGNIVKKPLCETLIGFCEANDEFAQAVMQSSGTLADCCKKVLGKPGSGISDIAVYRKAVAFYFPGADVRMEMRVDLCASVGGDQPAADDLIIDLSDFF